MEMRTVKVWDIAVRTCHWLLVVFFLVSYLSGDDNLLHIFAGYAVLGLIVFRIVWGFIGSKYARFTDFVCRPKTAADYLVAVIRGKPLHYIGHNPLAGWMTVLLLISLISCSMEWPGNVRR